MISSCTGASRDTELQPFDQSPPQGTHVFDFGVNLLDLPLDQRNGATRVESASSLRTLQGKQLLDLLDGKAVLSGLPDAFQQFNGLGRILAVTRQSSRRTWKEPLPLVKANGLDAHIRETSHLADAHGNHGYHLVAWGS